MVRLQSKTHNCNQNNLLLSAYLRSLIVQKRRTKATWQRTKYPTDKTNYSSYARYIIDKWQNNARKTSPINPASSPKINSSLWRITRKILKIKQYRFQFKKCDSSFVIESESRNVQTPLGSF